MSENPHSYQTMRRHWSCGDLLGFAGGIFGLILLIVIIILLNSGDKSMSERQDTITRAATDYFNVSIRSRYFECDQLHMEYFRFLDTLVHIGGFQDSIFNAVTPAEKANGIQEKTDITITFIYRDSSTSEWEDAIYKLWLEKRTNWQVVKFEKIQ